MVKNSYLIHVLLKNTKINLKIGTKISD